MFEFHGVESRRLVMRKVVNCEICSCYHYDPCGVLRSADRPVLRLTDPHFRIAGPGGSIYPRIIFQAADSGTLSVASATALVQPAI